MNSVAWRLPSVMVPVLSSSSTSTSPDASTARPAHREDVVLEQTIHARDADGAQQPANGRGNQTHQQRDQHRHGEHRGGINAERFQRHADEQENERERREQNGERDFVRRLLAFRAFDERDHAVEKTFAGIDRDADFDFVGEHARAAGDGAAVAAAFADDGRGFAGDGGFIHGGRAFDDVAVGGNDFAGAHDDDIAFAQIVGADFFDLAVFADAAGDRVFTRVPRNALACALPRPSATASAKLAKSTVNQSQTASCAMKPRSADAVKMPTVVSTAPTIVTNMTGFLIIRRGLSFLKASPIAGPAIFQSKREGAL